MDIVYLLGTGTAWKNNEIKHSLRSLQKHADKFEKVFVVGEKPEFLNDEIIHIPFKDTSPYPNVNINAKLMHACALPELSPNFFYVHDDHFFMQDFSVSKFPYFYSGTITAYLNAPGRIHKVTGVPYGNYDKCIVNTQKALQAKKLGDIFFNVHTPIIVNKKKMLKVAKDFDLNVPHGVAIKSIYCNANNIDGEPFTDIKITQRLNREEILKRIKGSPTFSISDGWSQDMRDLFEKKWFPEKSRWEK
jgi:hypothetical protein